MVRGTKSTLYFIHILHVRPVVSVACVKIPGVTNTRPEKLHSYANATWSETQRRTCDSAALS